MSRSSLAASSNVALLVSLALLLAGCSGTPPPTVPVPTPTVTAAPRATASLVPQPGPSPAAAATPARPPRDQVEVLRVVDGDTIEVRFGHGAVATVRYLGIDTPETVEPSQPGMCFGKEASAKNAELVGGKPVQLERDASEADQHGRLLRYVWVTGPDGGTRLVNEELVKWGFAQSAAFPPDVKYQEIFVAAQREAQAEQRGLWGACGRFGAPAAATALPAGATTPPTAGPTTSAVTIVAATGGPPGGRATVTAEAPPNATCVITFITPAGTDSQAQGLVAKHAPASGHVSWAWSIGASTRAGIGRVTVACTPGGRVSAPLSIG
jgi:micrococcal nuclease